MNTPALRRASVAGTRRELASHDLIFRIWRLLLMALACSQPVAGLAQVTGGSAAARPDVPIARNGPQRVDAVEAELIADVRRAAPGTPFRLGLRLKHDAGWHTYWRNPGDSGLPTRFEPTGPTGTSYTDIIWPAPQRLAIGGLANYGYEGEVVLARQATLPATLEAPTARFEVLAQWLVCKEVCIPGEATLSLELPVAAGAEPATAASTRLFDDSAGRAPDGLAAAQAGWWQREDRAYLLLPPGVDPSRAEFFPYFEGVVRPAAPQALVQVAQGTDATTAQRLALRLETLPGSRPQGGRAGADPAQAPAGQELPELPLPAAGVLLLDGKPVEVVLNLMAAEPAAGSVLSVAEVAPPAPARSGGLLERLRGSAASLAPSGSGLAAVPATGSAAGSTATSTPAVPNGVARAFPSPALGAASGSFAIALVAALAGGLILNLMPCVFPVIGLKVLSFAQSAGGQPRLARLHALAFAGGVVLSFLGLGLALLALRSAGEAAGWGFQMQSPVFVGAMTLLFVLIALNLSGVFETGVAMTRLQMPLPESHPQSGAESRDLLRSFGTGVVAVLVATPCTAPFMGSAVGYTITSPALQTLTVFGALGVGMAAPYLVLGSAPGLLRRLPRPGAWLLVFKQLLAFPMLATAAWLAWVLTLQAGADGLLRLLMSAVLVAFAAWLFGRAQSAGYAGRSRWLPLSLAASAGLLTLWHLAQLGAIAPAQSVVADASGTPFTQAKPGSGRPSDAAGTIRAPDPVAGEPEGAAEGGDNPATASASWRPWSAQRVAQALSERRPVVVDFTAAWCISCQVNKKLVLDREVVRNAFDASRAVLLRADWTSRDPAITAELGRFGRNGVPLYLVYVGADEPPLMLPELLTVEIVLAALAEAR